jgi:hypothetical protein
MTIRMGNDEFILHIRKNFPNCIISNDQLGKRIWQWIEMHDPFSEIIVRDQPCQWGNSELTTSEVLLPKTATQFQFSIAILPQLYAFLGGTLVVENT